MVNPVDEHRSYVQNLGFAWQITAISGFLRVIYSVLGLIKIIFSEIITQINWNINL